MTYLYRGEDLRKHPVPVLLEPIDFRQFSGLELLGHALHCHQDLHEQTFSNNGGGCHASGVSAETPVSRRVRA